MTNMKMKVNNPEHSKAVQEWLFEEGRSWLGGGREVRYTDAPFLYADEQGQITYSKDAEYFAKSGSVEVDVAKFDPVGPETTEISLEVGLDEGVALMGLVSEFTRLTSAIEQTERNRKAWISQRGQLLKEINDQLPEGWILTPEYDG